MNRRRAPEDEIATEPWPGTEEPQHIAYDDLHAHQDAAYEDLRARPEDAYDHLRVHQDDALVKPAATPPPPEVRRSSGTRTARILLLLILAVLGWGGWAAAAFYDFTVGLRDNDSIVLERRIDWISVREALQEDLPSTAAATPGESASGTILSRRGITEFLRNASLDRRPSQAATPAGWALDAAPFPWRRIRYAFFTGGPVMFRVDLAPASGGNDPTVLLFHWSGDWRLTRIVLPAQTRLASQLVAAASPPTSRNIAAPAGPGRATLTEDLPDNRDSRSSTGTVTWSAVPSPATDGGPASLAVVAHVSIPSRPLDMTMTIRRNLDPALPATHMFEIDFKEPSPSASDSVTGMLGVTMRPEEKSSGETLTGSHVKVRDGFFLLGLSALPVEVERNLSLLKDQPWLGIPIRFKNGIRGVLAIEKSDAGRKSIAAAFAQWDAVSSAAKSGN